MYLLLDKKLCFLIIAISLILSCKKEPEVKSISNYDEIPIFKANNFQLFQNEDSIKVLQIKSKYSAQKSQTVSKDPKKLIVTSSTFIPYLKSLNKLDRIIAVADGKYISDSTLHHKVQNNELYSYESSSPIDKEWLIVNQPDLIVTYIFSKQDSINLSQYQKLKINTLVLQPFEESDPVGRVEWIKVLGALFNQDNVADSIYNQISNNYDSIKKQENTHKPIVLSGSPFEGVWWVPGGQSLTAKIIEDAGGNYLFKNDSHHVAYPVDFETILVNADKVDYWINTNPFTKFSDVLNHDSRLKYFKAHKNKSIFNHLKSKRDWGSDNFYEYGVFRPDLVLKDLKKIFQKSQLNENDLVFYESLKD